MKKRIVSILLCLMLILSLIPVWSASVSAATESQLNIVDRANYLFDATWVCKRNVNGWCDSYTFVAGNTYHIPYGQPVTAGAYVGFGVSVDDYLAAAADATRAFGFGVDVGHCRAVVIVGAQGLESLGVGGLRCGFGTGDDGLGLRGFGACGRLPGLFWDGVCIVFFGH